MGIMAVGAGHLSLAQRMMGKEFAFHLHLRMAAIAEFRHLLPLDFLLRALVESVAVNAAYIIESVSARIPMGKIRGGSG